ncbi:short-chain dehydrogenase/reductase family Oxidoreductase [Colletotrichum cuscutae]|uniref:Short-chain dehydrogenase/reductase family Oxidoreductase n=1 Tax=Colletotrichum cuscutae TaxID=1209917 RepID=A0AAI9TYA9_9PEZI|nr:short-chain dehydrogenase/reductase family Oxidoreductase [Colletotrichum cuscutae]
MAPTLGRETTGTELVAEYASHVAGKTILVTGVSPGGLGAGMGWGTDSTALPEKLRSRKGMTPDPDVFKTLAVGF